MINAMGKHFIRLVVIEFRRVLKQTQLELRKYGNDMIEDICLNLLIRAPVSFLCENINLQRQPLSSWLQLTHQTGEIRVNVRMLPQVVLQVNSKRTDVGQPASIEATLPSSYGVMGGHVGFGGKGNGGGYVPVPADGPEIPVTLIR